MTSAGVSPNEDRVFLLALSQHSGAVEESNALTRCPSCGTLTTAASSYCGSCGDPMTSAEDMFAQDDWYSWA
jgi:hypothetical protein